MSHPLKLETSLELAALGGPAFDDIVASPVPRIELPLYTPQPRRRKALRGYLNEGVYFVRARDAVRRQRVTTAAEMRRAIGLRPDQKLLVLLFDRDAILEDIWARGAALIRELVDAGYDGVISPSFSTYTPRPRTEFLINAKRSLLYFRALQIAGAYAIPRVAWNVSHDARRSAEWICDNPSVEMVSLDLSTYRVPADWNGQLEGLEIFDSITRRQITYLVNGPSTEERCRQLFAIAGIERVRVTNSTTQARIPNRGLRSTEDQTGVTFRARLAVRRNAVERAAVSMNRLGRDQRAA